MKMLIMSFIILTVIAGAEIYYEFQKGTFNLTDKEIKDFERFCKTFKEVCKESLEKFKK